MWNLNSYESEQPDYYSYLSRPDPIQFCFGIAVARGYSFFAIKDRGACLYPGEFPYDFFKAAYYCPEDGLGGQDGEYIFNAYVMSNTSAVGKVSNMFDIAT